MLPQGRVVRHNSASFSFSQFSLLKEQLSSTLAHLSREPRVLQQEGYNLSHGLGLLRVHNETAAIALDCLFPLPEARGDHWDLRRQRFNLPFTVKYPSIQRCVIGTQVRYGYAPSHEFPFLRTLGQLLGNDR